MARRLLPVSANPVGAKSKPADFFTPLTERKTMNLNQQFLAWLLVWLVAKIVVVCVLLRLFAPQIKWAREYAANMQKPGFLPPPPTDRGQAWMMRLSRSLSWLFIGKITVRGLENLDTIPTKSFICAPNHGSPYDVVLMPTILNRKARYMAALAVMQTLRGIGGLVVGPLGAFACNLERGKGGGAFKAAKEILCTGQTLVMFPEGWTTLTGKFGPFKKGVVRIARGAAEEMGEETYVVPVSITYGRYANESILRLPIQVQYLALAACFLWYRRGATVIFGKPIPSSALPESDDEATEMLKSTIRHLGNHS